MQAVAGLLIKQEMMGCRGEAGQCLASIEAAGNLEADFCCGYVVGIDYQAHLTDPDSRYTPLLILNPNNSLPALRNNVWSLFDSHGWDEEQLPEGLALGEAPTPEEVAKRHIRNCSTSFAPKAHKENFQGKY